MRLRGSAGFSLLEVLVALAILGMTMAVIFGGMSKAVKAVHSIDDTEQRIQQAREKLAEVELIGNIRAGDSAHGQYADGARWRLDTASFTPQSAISPQNPNAVIRLTLKLEWNSGSASKSWSVDTYRFITAVDPSGPNLQSQLDALR